ncbi:MAG: 5-methyltetrahydropteroyltriglutamate--homocysteine S-methyltransferase [Thiomonas sp.]
MIRTHTLGYPRIGPQREWKFALEAFWSAPDSPQADSRRGGQGNSGAAQRFLEVTKSSEAELAATWQALRLQQWADQRDAGLDMVTAGDFAPYDHIAAMTLRLGAAPARFGFGAAHSSWARHFALGRGTASQPALELTKWFDTNYHYLVPEIGADTRFTADAADLAHELALAREHGHAAKVVLPGPLTWLKLGKSRDPRFDPLTLLPGLIDAYAHILRDVHGAGAAWVQLDEPILALDLPHAWKAAFRVGYAQLAAALEGAAPKLLLAVYFGPLEDNLELACSLPVDGLHVDLVRGRAEAAWVAERLGAGKVLSAGVIDGRNIWRADLDDALALLRSLKHDGEIWISPSCSLLHVPVDLEMEDQQGSAGPSQASLTPSGGDAGKAGVRGRNKQGSAGPSQASLTPSGGDAGKAGVRGRTIPEPFKSGMAFARQKLGEISLLAQAMREGEGQSTATGAALQAARAARAARLAHPSVARAELRARMAALPSDQRAHAYPQRAVAQEARFKLPALPTTTIGSFPQTADIRASRAAFKRGEIDRAEYERRMREAIALAVRKQEELGLDVLVHGEAERNDMVEYFGEQFDGVLFTGFGWVQSYGSRCVKPPVIFGDVLRPQPMTVAWSAYAQSLTTKPMKGMLTGPVTLLQWAFVRDDLPRSEVALQLALAVRDEVQDLEAAGIGMIQIDEPAFREGLPLRHRNWQAYLDWAGRAFRLSASGVRDDTQIHTHMCYSEFNDIMPAIAALDADVISIETSRSDMELLRAFGEFQYPNAIGPGVWDIHSPRVPGQAEMERLLRKALAVIPASRLWVNPDCGLKTRGWAETEPALRNLTDAAKAVRHQAV